MKSTLSVSYQGRADDAKDATIVAVVTQANGEEYGAGFDSTTMERDLQFRVPSEQLDNNATNSGIVYLGSYRPG